MQEPNWKLYYYVAFPTTFIAFTLLGVDLDWLTTDRVIQSYLWRVREIGCLLFALVPPGLMLMKLRKWHAHNRFDTDSFTLRNSDEFMIYGVIALAGGGFAFYLFDAGIMPAQKFPTQ